MSQPAGPESTGASGPTLLRALGPGMAIAVVVGNVIGSGICCEASAASPATPAISA